MSLRRPGAGEARRDGAAAETHDRALVAACADGDRRASAELFERYGQMVFRYVARMTGARARDHEDLVQTTFLQMIRAARGFRGGSSVKTWILAIATNVVRHHIRTEARRVKLLVAVARDGDPEPSSPPDRIAEEREQVRRIAAGIAALPPALREVFVLVELEGLRGRDVAEVLGLREGTVWRRLHEARNRLREALAHPSEGEPT